MEYPESHDIGFSKNVFSTLEFTIPIPSPEELPSGDSEKGTGEGKGKHVSVPPRPQSRCRSRSVDKGFTFDLSPPYDMKTPFPSETRCRTTLVANDRIYYMSGPLANSKYSERNPIWYTLEAI